MEVVITYDTLYEILRREKGRDELQELDTEFYNQAFKYLKDKNKILQDTEVKTDLFSSTERGKTVTEIENIKKILKELYERRESKIINMAINKSRTNTGIINTKTMLPVELKFYQELVASLNKYRGDVLYSLINLKGVKETPKDESPDENQAEDSFGVLTVKFKVDVPKFVGEELEVYGPFSAGDSAELPEKIANLLIKKGKAE